MVEVLGEPFFKREGDLLVPSSQARGPWNPNSMHGRLLAGVLAHTTELKYGDPDFHYARLTIDLFRMPPLAPVTIENRVVRDGNRIKVAEGSLVSEGVEVARGSVVMLRKAAQPEGTVWSPPNWDVPSPDELPVPEPPPGMRGMGMWEQRAITARGFGAVEQKRAWIRESHPLVEGEALTPFVRAAVCADFTNPFANSGDRGLNFVNADITLYLHRLPETEWIGFEVASHQSEDGVAVGECSLFDVRGRIGTSTVCGVANQRSAGSMVPGSDANPLRPSR
jgi:hypothetical protein